MASGSEILPLDHFTQTLDYEGEIGVIVGKSGFRIDESNAMDHVWGYTIINDVTARERQRDHKQVSGHTSQRSSLPNHYLHRRSSS